jgi:hypothetical protein
MSSVGAQHVEAAVGEMTRVLMPHAEADWHVQAGSLEWSCWETAAHVAHDLVAYAGQVAGGRHSLVPSVRSCRCAVAASGGAGGGCCVWPTAQGRRRARWSRNGRLALGNVRRGRLRCNGRRRNARPHSRHHAGSWRGLAISGIPKPTCRRPPPAQCPARARVRRSALGHRPSGS